MADKSSVGYLPETSQEAIEANRAYQEALARLNQSLDVRKNRIMDPRWAAAAQGFFAPTRTGGWGEVLGNVVGNVNKADEAMALEEQNIAKGKLDIATQGLALQRLKEADKSYQNDMAPQGALSAGSFKAPDRGSPTGPLIAYGSAPSGAAPEGGALPSSAAQGVPQGIQIAPAMEGLLTREQFLAKQRRDNVPYEEAVLKWEEVLRKRRDTKESGMFDASTGKFYGRPTGTLVKRQVPSQDGKPSTIEVPEGIALQMDDALSRNDIATYMRLAKPYISPGLPAAPTQGTTTPATPPTGAAPQAPTGGQPRFLSVEEQKRMEEQEKSDRAIEEARLKALAQKRSETSAAREAELPKIQQSARSIYSSASRVEDAVKKSGNYFGLFERPGFVASIGSILDDIKRTPQATVEKGTFENAMRKIMPGVQQKDLDAVTNAAADLAEIELAYTQLYLTKQGAITEGERAIVRRLGGGVSNSPSVLKSRMQLLKERSQYDIDRVDAFHQWQDQNPNGTIDQFERSTGAKNLERAFEKRLASIFGTAPAVPSRERKPSDSASRRLDELLGK
ncbi:MAG: hypothetical protein EBR82_52755 [Caulobacteraceae bacterium]|nr:hypothetical protein [Caulobacteraceae bacterium]